MQAAVLWRLHQWLRLRLKLLYFLSESVCNISTMYNMSSLLDLALKTWWWMPIPSPAGRLVDRSTFSIIWLLLLVSLILMSSPKLGWSLLLDQLPMPPIFTHCFVPQWQGPSLMDHALHQQCRLLFLTFVFLLYLVFAFFSLPSLFVCCLLVVHFLSL